MKRRNKQIFKVTGDIVDDSESFGVAISAGTSGKEMLYALSALLSVILAHENITDKPLSMDGLLSMVKAIMRDSEIGVPKNNDKKSI